MFILYAVPIGILAGYLIGGRLDALGQPVRESLPPAAPEPLS